MFLGVSVLLSLLLPRNAPAGAGLLTLSLAVPTVLAASVAIMATRLRGSGPVVDLRLERWSWDDVRLGFVYGLCGLVVSLPASTIYVALAGPDTSSAVGEVFGDVRSGPMGAIALFVVLVLLAPLCEEIVYRGLLWGALERLGARPWVAFAVTTLLFALAHLEFARTPLLLVVAIPIGLARLRTGRLLPSIVAHQVNNVLPAAVLILGLLGVPLPVT